MSAESNPASSLDSASTRITGNTSGLRTSPDVQAVCSCIDAILGVVEEVRSVECEGKDVEVILGSIGGARNLCTGR